MIYTCPAYRNRFRPFWSAPWFARRITYRFSTDGSLQYTAGEFNDRTGPAWGVKFFYLTTLFGQHRNSLNWSLTHLDGMTLNAYWYRDGEGPYDSPISYIKPNQDYLLGIDATGGMVQWYLNGVEVYRIENWKPAIWWIFSPFYGKSGRDGKPKAVAPHPMRMNINFVKSA